jgi:hypothetical protein
MSPQLQFFNALTVLEYQRRRGPFFTRARAIAGPRRTRRLSLVPATDAQLFLRSSNLGDRQSLIAPSICCGISRIDVLRQPLAETAPLGRPRSQGMYLNGAALISTSLEPVALLAALQTIERQLAASSMPVGAADDRPRSLLYGTRLDTPGCRSTTLAGRRFVLAAAETPDMRRR